MTCRWAPHLTSICVQNLWTAELLDCSFMLCQHACPPPESCRPRATRITLVLLILLSIALILSFSCIIPLNRRTHFMVWVLHIKWHTGLMEITCLGVQKQIVSLYTLFKHKELEMTNHNIFWLILLYSYELNGAHPYGSGLPRWHSVKNPPTNAGEVRDMDSVPGSVRSPRGGSGNLLQ